MCNYVIDPGDPAQTVMSPLILSCSVATYTEFKSVDFDVLPNYSACKTILCQKTSRGSTNFTVFLRENGDLPKL